MIRNELTGTAFLMQMKVGDQGRVRYSRGGGLEIGEACAMRVCGNWGSLRSLGSHWVVPIKGVGGWHRV